MGTGFQSGGAWLWHPTPSIAEAKERVELHFSPPPRAFVACCRVNFTFYVMYTELDSIFVDLCSWIYLEALKKKKDSVLCIRVKTTTRDLLIYQQRCSASSLSVGYSVYGEW